MANNNEAKLDTVAKWSLVGGASLEIISSIGPLSIIEPIALPLIAIGIYSWLGQRFINRLFSKPPAQP